MSETPKTQRMERDPEVWKHAQFWIKREDNDRLREKFPAPRNGVRWGDVIKAALAAQPRW